MELLTVIYMFGIAHFVVYIGFAYFSAVLFRVELESFSDRTEVNDYYCLSRVSTTTIASTSALNTLFDEWPKCNIFGRSQYIQ